MRQIRRITAFLGAVLLTLCCAGTALAGDAAIKTSNIEIAKYKGLEIPVQEPEEITEAYVDSMIEDYVSQSRDKVNFADRPIEPDDWVSLDINCDIDGETYADLCYAEIQMEVPHEEDAELSSMDLLGAIAVGAEGHYAGESYTVDFTIPEDYSLYPDVAGKEAHWSVDILESYSYIGGELTDDFVAALGIEGVETVEEFRAYRKETLEEQAIRDAHYQMQDAALTALKKEITVIAYPEDRVQAYIEEYVQSYKDNADMLDISYEEFLDTYLGMSEEEFNAEISKIAEDYVAEDLALTAIAQAEDLTVTDEYYQENVDAFARSYNYEDGASMESLFAREDIRASMERERVLDFLIENSNQVETGESPADTLENAIKEGKSLNRWLVISLIGAAVLLVILIVLIAILARTSRAKKDARRVEQRRAEAQQAEEAYASIEAGFHEEPETVTEGNMRDTE